MKKKYGDKIREAIYQQELNPVYRSIFTNEIQNILYEAIDQTREETIKEMEWEIENWEIVDGKSFTSDKIKEILNKLKK